MVTLVNLSNSVTFTPTANVNVSWQKSVNLTVVPIPLNDNPVVMNYGGCNIQLEVSFDIFSVNDLGTIMNNFQSASNTSGYQVQIPEWNATVTGYVSSCNIRQVAGEGSHWVVSLVFYVGTLV